MGITILRKGGDKFIENWDLGIAQEYVMPFDSFHIALIQFKIESMPLGKGGLFKFDTTSSVESGIWATALTSISITDVTIAVNALVGGLSSLAFAGSYIRIQWIPTPALEPVGAKANAWMQAKSL